ncbi:MAG: AMP-binding protein [Desulfovibrionaceae bacterium]
MPSAIGPVAAHAAGLAGGFLASVRAVPKRPALEVGDAVHTYEVLAGVAGRIARAIAAAETAGANGGPGAGGSGGLAAVFASRSLTAYAGVLGVLLSGRGYVPLNKHFPAERTRTMLTLSGCRTVVVDARSLDALQAALPGVDTPLTLIFPEIQDVEGLGGLDHRFPQHAFMTMDVMPEPEALAPLPLAPVDPAATAYLLFTSGSTGVPKGVPVRHESACAYVDYVTARYGVTFHDRLSQTFDLTFDLSVHDMFTAWGSGACLVCTPERAVMAPARHIREKNLSMWFSVPSVAMFMARLRLLKPGAFPSLRWSLFCGEPLPASSAALWQAAAPNSVVENLYGPTEATIAIAHYRWDQAASPAVCRNGIVPIGTVFAGQRGCVVDATGAPVEGQGRGELCVAGPQVQTGYLNNPEKSVAQFVPLPLCGEGVWYRTGDVVERDVLGDLHYVERVDNQVKIRGHRVELPEIAQRLREAAGTDMAACVPWPVENGLAGGVYGFVCVGGALDEEAAIAYCARYLPEYMVPRRVFGVASMPLNSNGKIDRKALAAMLEELLDG